MVNIRRGLVLREPGKRQHPCHLSAKRYFLAPGMVHPLLTFMKTTRTSRTPEGQVAIAILVSQRKHGLHKHVLGLEAQGLGKLGPAQLTRQGLPHLCDESRSRVPASTWLISSTCTWTAAEGGRGRVEAWAGSVQGPFSSPEVWIRKVSPWWLLMVIRQTSGLGLLLSLQRGECSRGWGGSKEGQCLGMPSERAYTSDRNCSSHEWKAGKAKDMLFCQFRQGCHVPDFKKSHTCNLLWFSG